MKITSLALVAACFATAFATAPAYAGPAGEACPRWRCGFNGTSTNGISLNGARLNGFRWNGLRVNGLRLNGLQLNGLGFNGVSETGGAIATPTVTAVRLPAGKRLTSR
jgi:hypothetical protein